MNAIDLCINTNHRDYDPYFFSYTHDKVIFILLSDFAAIFLLPTAIMQD